MPTTGQPDYTALDFPPPPADRPTVVINMVSSADGKVTIEGTERGLGSPSDQRLMRELRVHADVILNGAGTLRASGTSSRLDADELEDLRQRRGKPRQPIAVVLSRSGDLPLERAFFTRRDFEGAVYLSQSAPADRRAAIAATGRPVYDVPPGDEFPAMLRHMRHDLGAALLLVEGGPSINGELFRLGLVDQLFLTIGPVVVSGRGLPGAVESDIAPTIDAAPQLALLSVAVNPDTDEIYLRYRVRSG